LMAACSVVMKAGKKAVWKVAKTAASTAVSMVGCLVGSRAGYSVAVWVVWRAAC